MRKLKSSEYTIFVRSDDDIIMMCNRMNYQHDLSNLPLTMSDMGAYVLYKNLGYEAWANKLKGIIVNSTVERLNIITGQDFVEI